MYFFHGTMHQAQNKFLTCILLHLKILQKKNEECQQSQDIV